LGQSSSSAQLKTGGGSSGASGKEGIAQSPAHKSWRRPSLLESVAELRLPSIQLDSFASPSLMAAGGRLLPLAICNRQLNELGWVLAAGDDN